MDYLYAEKTEWAASYPSELQMVLRELNALGIKWRKKERGSDLDEKGFPQSIHWMIFIEEEDLEKLPIEY